jgi:hypothetical protein
LASVTRQLLKLQPGIVQIVRPALGTRIDPELVEHMIDGLRTTGWTLRLDDRRSRTRPITYPATYRLLLHLIC